jgi:hypothetical protein
VATRAFALRWTIAEDFENAGSTAPIFKSLARRSAARTFDLELGSGCRPSELPPADRNFSIGKSSSRTLARKGAQTSGVPRVFWQPAPLTPYETDTILRYSVCCMTRALREEVRRADTRRRTLGFGRGRKNLESDFS